MKMEEIPEDGNAEGKFPHYPSVTVWYGTSLELLGDIVIHPNDVHCY